MPSPAYFGAPPFHADDILKLAEFAPAQPQAISHPEEMADRLSQTFRHALDWIAMSKQQVPVKKFYLDVARLGRELLKVLGLPSDDPFYIATFMSRDDVHHTPGVLRLEQTPSKALDWLATNRMMRGDYADTCYGLAAMISAAEGAVQEATKSKPTRRLGRPPDHFQGVLFNGLAWLHKAMFDRWPEIDFERGDRGGKSVSWAEEVILLARERIPRVLRPSFETPEAWEAVRLETKAINELSELSTSTIADWLKKGVAVVRPFEAR
jgi:hypothetical protein